MSEVARLMSDGRMQPDDGIYELLVAAAYSRRGWMFSFVPEMPGLRKQQDLIVEKSGSSWAVECKRAGRSDYARKERDAGHQLADAVTTCRFERTDPCKSWRFSRTGCKPRSVVPGGKGASLHAEPEATVGMTKGLRRRQRRPMERASASSPGRRRQFRQRSNDRIVDGNPCEHDVDYSLGGAWTTQRVGLFHATSVQHVNLVGWSTSSESARRKAQHFRGIVGRACEQLPGDRPGAIHVGYKAVGGKHSRWSPSSSEQRADEGFRSGRSQLQVVLWELLHARARNRIATRVPPSRRRSHGIPVKECNERTAVPRMLFSTMSHSRYSLFVLCSPGSRPASVSVDPIPARPVPVHRLTGRNGDGKRRGGQQPAGPLATLRRAFRK